MTEINLLPENLRDKEEKELKKSASRRKVLTMEMAFPEKEKKPDRKSWWRKSFGASPRPPKPVEPKSAVIQEPSSRIDLLSAARKQKMKYLKSNGKKSGKKFNLTEVFGPPRSPLQSSPGNQIVSEEKKQPRIVEKRRSFWSGLFKPKPRKLKLVVHAPPSLKSLETQSIEPEEVELENNMPEKIEKKKVLEPVKIKETLKKNKGFWSRLFKPVPHKPKLRIKMEAEKKQLEIKPVKLPPRPKEKPVKVKRGRKFHLAPKKEESFDINLMPKELVLVSYYRPGVMILIFLLAVILPAMLVGGVWLGIKNYQEKTDAEIAAAQEQVDILRQELSDWREKQKKSFELQRKLLTIKDLFSGKVYWTGFFDLLEKYTLDDVYYTDFAADVSGEFTLPAIAADYDALAKQIVALRGAEDFARDVKVENIRLFSTEKAGVSGFSFDLKLYLVNNVFSKK